MIGGCMIIYDLFQKFIYKIVLFIFSLNFVSQSYVFAENNICRLLKKDKPELIEKKIRLIFGVNEISQEHYESIFFNAVSFGSVRTIKFLIDRGISMDIRSSVWFDRTPLLHAIANSNVKAALCLIYNGANLSVKDRIGNTPLHLSVHRGLFQIVELLIKKGISIDERDEHDYTPLHNAVEQGRVREVISLLLAGANPNAQTCNGDTPLHLALIGLAHNHKKYFMKKQLFRIIKILGKYNLDFSKREVYNQWHIFDMLNYLNFSQSEHKSIKLILEKIKNNKVS